MFRLVNKKDVERLKTIFLSTRLISDIEIKKDNINLILTDGSIARLNRGLKYREEKIDRRYI